MGVGAELQIATASTSSDADRLLEPTLDDWRAPVAAATLVGRVGDHVEDGYQARWCPATRL